MPFEPREGGGSRRDRAIASLLGARSAIQNPLLSLFGGGNGYPTGYPYGSPAPNPNDVFNYIPSGGSYGVYTGPGSTYQPTAPEASYLSTGQYANDSYAPLEPIEPGMWKGFMGNENPYAPVSAETQPRVAPTTYLERKNQGQGQGPQGQNNALWRRLVNSANDVPVIDFDDLIAEQTAALMKAYKPQIKGLRGDIKRTKREGAESREEIGDLWGGYERRLRKQAGRQEGRTTRTQEGIEEETQEEIGAASDTRMDDAKAMAKMLRGMGQPEQAKDILLAAQQQINRETGEIREEGEFEEGQAADTGEAREKYLRTFAHGAALEGNAEVSAIADQEADIIHETRMGIAGLKQARGSEISGMETSLGIAEAESNVDAARMVWDRLFGLQGMKNEMDQFDYQKEYDLAQMALGAQEGGEEEENAYNDAIAQNMNDVYTILNYGVKNPQNRAAATEFFDSFLMNPAMRRGEIEGEVEGENIPYTVEQKVADIRAAASEEGFNENTIEQLVEALRAYSWKGKG